MANSLIRRWSCFLEMDKKRPYSYTKRVSILHITKLGEECGQDGEKFDSPMYPHISPLTSRP